MPFQIEILIAFYQHISGELGEVHPVLRRPLPLLYCVKVVPQPRGQKREANGQIKATSLVERRGKYEA
jgi:hypothetical protein